MKVRLGIIGSNFISDRIIAASRLEPRIELAALYSRTAERGAEYAAQHAIPRVFTSLDEMLAATAGAGEPLIDAVYIASPNALHAPQAIAALEAGKHVLCEKPIASNAREAREMVAAARRAGRLLMEAMKPTLTPGWQAVRDALPRVGRVRRWFAAFGKYSSRMDALKAALANGGETGAAGLAAAIPNAFNPALANGAAMDIGVYAIYPMVQLFGQPNSLTASVLTLPSGVDGHGAVNFAWDEMLGTILYSKMVDMALPWEIEGEDGTLRGDAINAIRQVDFRARRGSGTAAGSQANAKLPDEWVAVAAGSQATQHEYIDYVYELAHFVDLIAAGAVESPINSHEVSVGVMEIVDEIRRQTGIVYPADAKKPTANEPKTPTANER